MRKKAQNLKAALVWGLLSLALPTTTADAQKFYPDDPLEKEPDPIADAGTVIVEPRSQRGRYITAKIG